MGFREDAIAAYQEAQADARAAAVAAARTTLTPVLADAEGKVLFDPKLLVAVDDPAIPDGAVVLRTSDDTYFLVQGSTVRLTWFDADRWVSGAVVTSAVEVGRALLSGS